MQLLIFNEEFLVRVVHQTALITSLPLVHTARRYYRLDGLVSLSDCGSGSGNRTLLREVTQTLSSRGSKSRNKVSVGEPAEGSLPLSPAAPPGLWTPAAAAERPRSRSGPKASRTRSSAGPPRRGPRCPSPPGSRSEPGTGQGGARRAARPPHGCPAPAVLRRRARGWAQRPRPGPPRRGGDRGARGSVCRPPSVLPTFVFRLRLLPETKEYNS